MADLPFRPTAKLVIIPYAPDSYDIPIGPPFVAMYNPTSISLQRVQTNSSKDTTQNNNQAVQETLQIDSSTFNVDLFFDGTGASPPLGLPTGSNVVSAAAVSAAGVQLLLDAFFETTILVSGDTHTTNNLKLIWGAGLSLQCKLQSYTTEYTLMDQAGLPLRAKISASFVETAESSLFAKLKNKLFSPDLTKTYLVRAGDTIFNIAENEYGDESFYTQIAQVNDLKNFRKLTPGQTLILPPVAKT